MTSFAEANDHLYAAVGQQVYERVDRTDPRTGALIYSNPSPSILAQRGLRGLTAIPKPGRRRAGAARRRRGQKNRASSRINPRGDGSEATDLDLRDFLDKS